MIVPIYREASNGRGRCVSRRSHPCEVLSKELLVQPDARTGLTNSRGDSAPSFGHSSVRAHARHQRQRIDFDLVWTPMRSADEPERPNV